MVPFRFNTRRKIKTYLEWYYFLNGTILNIVRRNTSEL